MELTHTLERRPAVPMILKFAGLEAGGLRRRIARAFGINRPAPIDIDDITVPDTQITKDATELVERCSPAFLVNHCLRTYCFGVAIGRHLRLQPDLEVFYLSALLHDLALTETYDTDGSFELNGARAARTFLLDKDYPPARADLVHEAIALHSSVGIADRREPEIALVHFGAGLDVIGVRAEDIAAATRDAIVARYPRLDFKREFSRLLEDQCGRKPACHIAGHVALGFQQKIRRAPFGE